MEEEKPGCFLKVIGLVTIIAALALIIAFLAEFWDSVTFILASIVMFVLLILAVTGFGDK